MATSLAAQLQRLAVPQTTLLYDSRKRPSILFESKEAASKEREVIYDIGVNGLEELIQMNSSFMQFGETLFDKSSIDLQRSVENKELNAKLDAGIHKFFFHLSPYFMLQPAHKCLEWLIRRYNVHEFNRKEFMYLILPYHETRIFVRCVQTLTFTENDSLAFLQGAAKSGVPLSKQSIIAHAVRRPEFLKSYGNFLTQAVKELDNKANILQSMFAFYCTTVIGTLENLDNVTEGYIVAVLKCIGKGLSSKAIDFTAASYMMLGQIVLKTTLLRNTLEFVLGKLCSLLHPTLTTDATMLLLLIFQTQQDQLAEMSDELLGKIASAKWIPSAVSAVKSEGIDITAFYRNILAKCLAKICKSHADANVFRNFCEQLLMEINLSEEEAEQIIQGVLDSYFRSDKSKPERINNEDITEIISLDSDDEEFESKDEKVTQWYSEFLSSFEKQYPAAFDVVVKRIMKGHDHLSQNKRNALRNVLGFLLKMSYSESDTSMYENLFHYDEHRRVDAVRYLVRNFRTICKDAQQGTKDLLRDSLSERLSDDSSAVVTEVLKLGYGGLSQVIGRSELIERLTRVCVKCLRYPKAWQHITETVIALLTNEQNYQDHDKNVRNRNLSKIIIALYPFMFPFADDPVSQRYAEIFLSTKFAREQEMLKLCTKQTTSINCISLLEVLEQEQMKGAPLQTLQVCFQILLVSSTLPPEAPVAIMERVFDYVETLLKGKFKYSPTSNLQCLQKNMLPMDICSIPVGYIIERGSFSSENVNLTEQSPSLRLQLRILNLLLEKYFTIDSKYDNMRQIYGNLLAKFLREMYPSVNQRIEFLCSICSANLTATSFTSEGSQNFIVTAHMQVRVFRILEAMLGKLDDFVLSGPMLFNILLAVRSELAVVRECAIATLEAIAKKTTREVPRQYADVLKSLLNRREELSLDCEQISLLIFVLFEYNDQNSFPMVQREFFTYAANMQTPSYIASGILDLFKLMDNGDILGQCAERGLHILSQLDAKGHTTVGPFESNFLQLLLDRLNATAIAKILLDPACQKLFETALRCHSPLTTGSRKFISPAIVLMKNINDEFFTNLPTDYARKVLTLIVEGATFSDDPETSTVAAKLIKELTVNAELTLPLLDRMRMQPNARKDGTKPRLSAMLSNDALVSDEWKCGVTLLEMLQSKKKLNNAHLLVPKLFECLKVCLDFAEQSAVEYVKQIILSLLLHCCTKSAADGEDAKVTTARVFKVEHIVQCIRGTQNPQTHHHALLLLSYAAQIVPDQVLHNMMQIFTFMGSSLLRQDDAYSFQIISKIIETIIPTLAKSGHGTTYTPQQVLPILKIFSDVILDVPQHRRVLLYVKLLQTLGAEDFLWMFLVVLIESDVRKGGKQAEMARESHRGKNVRDETEASSSDLSRRLQMALDISREFEPTEILHTCNKLVGYLHTLPVDVQKRKYDEPMEVHDNASISIIDLDALTSRQMKHFKYSSVEFVRALVSSTHVINKVAQLNEEQTLAMKRYYQNMIVTILTYVNAVSAVIDKMKVENSNKEIPLFWRAILNNCYDILESTISLLSADTLIIVVNGLLKHRFLMVRRKVIELLNNKLQYKQEYFNENHHTGLLKLLDPLALLAQNVCQEEAVIGSTFERTVIVQLSYMSLRHLAKILAQDNSATFQVILTGLVEQLHNYKQNPNPQILASLILCIGELCINLGPHAINHLPSFMPMIAKFINAQLQAEVIFDMLTSSIVMLLVKIVDSLALFLSPYLRAILVGLSTLYAKAEERNDPRLSNIMSRFSQIWEKLASSVPMRVLIPTIGNSYDDLVKKETLEGIGPLTKLLSIAFGKLQPSEFSILQRELADFFLAALQLRCNNAANAQVPPQTIDTAEQHVIKAFVVLILKLSENTFRPLFYKVYNWSTEEDASKDRAITLFNLSSNISEALKSLFVLFASDLMENAVKLLNATNIAKVANKKELHFRQQDKNTTLTECVLKTLHNILLYDNQNFINPTRFDQLVGPIVDQLENKIIFEHQSIRMLVVQCLGQLAVAVMDDSLWRQLNHLVLLKTRSDDPEIRLFALESCTEIARKLGESYTPLLPETIPFLAELMEDDNEVVEKAVHSTCQEIGRVTGEDLKKYF